MRSHHSLSVRRSSSGLASVSTAIVTDFVLRLGFVRPFVAGGADDDARLLLLSRRVTAVGATTAPTGLAASDSTIPRKHHAP